ncbi:phosphoenolpyruvate--protein phosphotransferase [Treponema sp. OttesenSCG-928-L16]|nr:phosphoenolpyruvate--protein phosphotransferase [Treponema sp. OttesenSCG-928-L16]
MKTSRKPWKPWTAICRPLKNEMEYRGIGACEGAVIDKALVVRHGSMDSSGSSASSFLGVDAELERFRKGREEVFQDLKAIARETEEKVGSDEAGIFEGYAEILMDDEIEDKTKVFIEAGLAAERAVQKAMDSLAEEFKSLEDEYMRERAADIADIGRRLTAAVAGEKTAQMPLLTEPCILVADDLSPFETVKLDHACLRGLALDAGGSTGHVAILARSLGIPCVVGLKNASASVKDGMVCALHGGKGLLITEPDEKTVGAFTQEEAERVQRMEILSRRAAEEAVTLDGKKIPVCGNIGSLEDAERLAEYGADSAGLLRTEFLYMDGERLPSEDEQFEKYRHIISALGGKPLTIRTLDIGGDKDYPALGLAAEQNPYLGYRAIRIGLDKPALLKPQLRAILRASAFGPVELMFPLVVSVDELRKIKSRLFECRDELVHESYEPGSPKIGIMVETPAAAIMAEELADESDFFSIGTNDLTQYTLAVDRGNPLVAGLYDSLDPAVLRLIAMTCRAAAEKGIPVSMCGELAADEYAVPVLLGLGLQKFSVAPSRIPAVKEALRKLDSATCRELAERVLSCSDAAEVRAMIGKKS